MFHILDVPRPNLCECFTLCILNGHMAWSLLKFRCFFFDECFTFWSFSGDMAWSLEQSRLQNVKHSSKTNHFCECFTFWSLFFRTSTFLRPKKLFVCGGFR